MTTLDRQTLWIESARVTRAEFLRHTRAAPVSFWLAAVLFPFITVVVLFYVPRLHPAAILHVLPAGYTVREHGLTPDSSRAAFTGRLLEALADQPYYRLVPVDDPAAAFSRGTVAVGIELAWTPGDTGISLEDAGSTPPGSLHERLPGPGAGSGSVLTILVHRRDDFWSLMFLRHVRQTASLPPLPEGEAARDVLVSLASASQEAQREGRSSLIQAAPFILIGFAWFFLTVAAVEVFVVDRERRTLEVLLTVPIHRVALAGGKLGFVFLEVTLAEAASVAGFLAVGFSPWVLSLLLLVLIATIPACVLSFRYCRDMDDAMSAGWKNGLVFMLGFPMVIIGDDIAGRWSPIYQLSRAFEGPPPAHWYAGILAASAIAAAFALSRLPSVARGWSA